MTPSERAALLSLSIKPSSDSEQVQQDRAERMVRDAIDAWPAFEGHRSTISVYTKGSYPNNTNVRSDSDVDVVVEMTACCYYDWLPSIAPPVGQKPPLYTGGWNPTNWRAHVAAALDAYFAGGVDTTGKVAILVPAVTGSRPSADVVPSFTFYRYTRADRVTYDVGSCVFDTSSNQIVNWPAQQLANGRAKNTATGGRYKNYVRALKNMENILVKAEVIKPVPSYLMECLVYNAPDDALVAGDLDEGFYVTLAILWNHLTKSSAAMVEPNAIKPLFRPDAKWTVAQAIELIGCTMGMLGYVG